MTFPEWFQFGAATAAYQIEGGVAEGGRGPSIWDVFARRPGNTVGDENGDIACDHFHRWERDVDLMADLGLQAYRFSIAWPRVQPTGTGEFNPEGIAFYSRLVDRLLERGIRPMITLYHWDLPQPLEDAGGWPARATVDAFATYAERMVQELGDRVTSWATFNEPWVASFVGYGSGDHAPGRADHADALAAAHHMNLAHARAYRVMKQQRADLEVGIVNNSHTPRPWDPSNAEDQAAAAYIDTLANGTFQDPFVHGRYSELLRAGTAHVTDWSFDRPGDLEEMAGAVDWFGVNYYASHLVRHTPSKRAAAPAVATLADGRAESGLSAWPGDDHAEFMPTAGPHTAMGWNVDPGALHAHLMKVHRETGKPIYVTENGSAWEDRLDTDGRVRDASRIAYLRDHLLAVEAAIAEGADVRGYLAWSLMDNFEWAQGYTKRFGLVRVDYDTLERRWKDSAYWYREAIRRRAVVPLELEHGAIETPARVY